MSAKIAAALHEVMAKVGYVQKTGINTFHNYKYAGEADLLASLRPAMVEAGLILIPSAEEVSPPDQHGNVTVRIGYTLAHKGGDVWPTTVYAVGTGNDMSPKTGRVGDKGVYKAITGANKYLLFKLFQIETGDDPEVTAKHETEEAPRKRRTSDIAPHDDGRNDIPIPTENPNAKSAYSVRKGQPSSWQEVVEFLNEAEDADDLRTRASGEWFGEKTRDWPALWLQTLRTEVYQNVLYRFQLEPAQ